jgi:zinc/manganese transport system substrate-binding protein
MILDLPQWKMRARGAWALAMCLLVVSCGHAAIPASRESPTPAAPGRPLVVATTSTLAALVRTVSDDLADVRALVPIGVSPETYEPTPRDLVALSEASVIVENGAGLETWLAKVLGNAPPQARVLVLSESLPVAVTGRTGTQVNPHFWLDPTYAARYVSAIADALAAVDPRHAAAYRVNAARERKRLAALDVWIRRQIAAIPPSRRVMVTDHDAWYYFDRRYGIQDLGAIESSPGKEPSAADFAALVALARARHVPAIFAEPEFSPRLAKELADSAGITTVTDLYDDSLGTTPALSTYEGMMKHDVTTIVRALR